MYLNENNNLLKFIIFKRKYNIKLNILIFKKNVLIRSIRSSNELQKRFKKIQKCKRYIINTTNIG